MPISRRRRKPTGATTAEHSDAPPPLRGRGRPRGRARSLRPAKMRGGQTFNTLSVIPVLEPEPPCGPSAPAASFSGLNPSLHAALSPPHPPLRRHPGLDPGSSNREPPGKHCPSPPHPAPRVAGGSPLLGSGGPRARLSARRSVITPVHVVHVLATYRGLFLSLRGRGRAAKLPG